jgi:hypothetical protein
LRIVKKNSVNIIPGNLQLKGHNQEILLLSLLEVGERVCPVLCSHRPHSVSTVERSNELNRSLAPLEWLGKYTVWPQKPHRNG